MDRSKRLEPFKEIIEKAAEKYKLPVWLIEAVIIQESGGNPMAVSRCGAQGLMQLMPDTGQQMGVKDPFDPEQNIMGGCKYLGLMMSIFNDDIRLALAAYNAGPGRVRHYHDVPPIKETQNYVRRIMAKAPKEENNGAICS